MDSSPAASVKHEHDDDATDSRDVKRTKATHDEGTAPPESLQANSGYGHQSPAPSTSRSASVGSPEKHRNDGSSLVKAAVKKNAKSKSAPNSSSRKVGKPSPFKVCLQDV